MDVNVDPHLEPPRLNGGGPGDTLELDEGFVVSTGIECSAPMIGGGFRNDQLRKTGHWERYLEDFSLIADLGIRYVRYGVPWHVISPEPGRFDWAWTDAAMSALRAAGLEPIADLFHFGVPDGLHGLGDPRVPERYAEYAARFSERFPWVRYYTPVNEPLLAAVMSAQAGIWNERARTEQTFVAALHNLVTCAVLGMKVLRERRPDAIFIQSEPCEGYDALDPAGQPLADFLNERRFVCFDLTYGRRPTPAVTDWLARHGVGEDRLAWFEEHGSSAGCIIGHDYYRGNEWLVTAAGRTVRAGSRRKGYAALAREYHARYGLPFMLSETNVAGSWALGWLAEIWNDAMTLREGGLPIRGFCWYGFIDHVDWDSCLTRDAGRQNRCGLVGLDRRLYGVGRQYGRLAQAARAGILEKIAYHPRPRGRRVQDIAA